MPKVNQPKPHIEFPSTPIAAKPPARQPAPQPVKLPRAYKIGCGVAAGVAILLLIWVIVSVANYANQQQTSSTQASSQPSQSTNDASTPSPVAPAATNGTPQIGGPISDFYGKYGQPNNEGNGGSETWIADQQQQTLVNASADANGRVTQVTLTSGANWSNDQTKQNCSQFLPPDASEFNTDGPYIDYHSSIGEVVMQISQSSCVLSMAQS